MGEIYLTSDLHFGHKNSIKFTNRPFKDTNEMDTILINNWNNTVSKKDTVYVLGDFSFHDLKNTTSIFERLNGNKCLLCGNHDKLKIVNKLKWNWVKDIYGFTYIGKYFWLSHYAHMSWNKSYYGSYHFFGHFHSTGQFWFNCNSCDVGVDYWGYKPVNIKELLDHINSVNKKADANKINKPFLWRGATEGPIEFFEFPNIR